MATTFTMTELSSNPYKASAALVQYGIRSELLAPEDAVYSYNLLLDALQLPPAEPPLPLCDQNTENAADAPALEEILRAMLDDAVNRGIIEDGVTSRDLLDTKLMGLLMPRPSEVIREFRARYAESPEAATDYFYALAENSDYIRRYRIRKDRKWIVSTRYGELDITINLSKPEKDPRAIAAALKKAQSDYPKCLLCRENEGYAGRLNHPARQNIRLIPLTLGGETWFLQYSPYVYYNEHCIVLSGAHTPMKIDEQSFSRLLEFVTLFPHYTVGSNADLPIVGGSILTHEHYQGGRYSFAMARAALREELHFTDFPDIRAGIVNWPMSVIRLTGSDPQRITALAGHILRCWRAYTDESADILSHGDSAAEAVAFQGAPHNTITPIARRREALYELDLVLRNNRTTEAYPLGIFHPHQELHHIKKENIGLIEVMGLAVLPARLLKELEALKAVILAGRNPASEPELAPHAAWVADILKRHPEFSPEAVQDNAKSRVALEHLLEEETGLVFARVLEHSGVFKDSPEGRAQFSRFAAAAGAGA